MTLVPVLIAVFCSSFCAGIVTMFFRELRVAKEQLISKVTEFDLITKRASEANTSLADKMLEFEKRLEQVEFRFSAGAFGSGAYGAKK